MHTRSGLLTRTGTRLLATAAVLIAITGLMLAGRAAPARALGATNGFFGFSATASSVVEGGATSLIVNRTGGSTGTVTVAYWSTPGSGCPASVAAQADLTNGLCVYGYLTFAGGDTSKSILVQTNDLLTVEGSRTVTFALTGADGGGELAGGSTGSHVVTITDNDGPSTYSYGSATQSAAEAAGLVNVPVIRNGSTAVAASVTCTITSGTAATPADFTLTTSLASFASGQTIANCQLTIVNDSTPENPDETIVMGFSGASGFGGPGSPLATTVTIVDDDGPGTLQFSQATYTVTEGVGTAAIAVSRTAGSSGTVSIQCSTTGGTATASPTAGYDYTAVTNQVLTWLDADATPKYCYIVITGDVAVEGTETITLGLTGVTGATAGAQSTATVNITDDDSTDVLAFSAVTYSSNENTTATITVTRTGTLAGTVGVSYSTSNGSAIAGSDYTTTTGTLSFGPAVSALSFAVPILADAVAESTETVVLTLSSPTGGATIGSPSTATLNILDGTTGLPTITLLNPASGPIGGGNTITISGANFSGATSVAFGTQLVAPSSVSSTSLTVIVPLSSTAAAQTVEVVVTTPAGPSSTIGTANDYTYTGGPTITLLSAATGPTTGATIVTITGTGFASTGMTVTFGGTTAVFTYNSATSITAVSPAHSAGLVNVVVTTTSGSSPDTVADDFTYTGASVPAITSISPTSGVIGTSVTVTGSGFTGATSVTVGGLSAAFTVVSDSSLTVTVPAGTANGVVDIRVTGPGGTSPNVTADDFTNTSTSGATTTYTLYFRWSLISWSGIDNISASNAVHGIETGTANAATNDVSASVTAIWFFDGPSQSFKGYFVGYDNTPGANDFTTLRRGISYWVAISTAGSVSWTVLQGS